MRTFLFRFKVASRGSEKKNKKQKCLRRPAPRTRDGAGGAPLGASQGVKAVFALLLSFEA